MQSIFLSPKSYDETRYRVFKETRLSPEQFFGDYEIQDETNKTIYCNAFFDTPYYRYYKKSKQRKKTFISEGIKNGMLTIL